MFFNPWWYIRIIVGTLCIPYSFDMWMHFINKPHTMPWFAGALIGAMPFLGKVRIWASIYILTLIIFKFVFTGG